MQLFEQYRPRCFADVVGQDKALAKLDFLRSRGGLAGRAYWLAGKSGSGKTTIARLIAAECAREWAVDEIDAQWLTPSRIADIARQSFTKPLGGGGWAYIVNESHGLSDASVRALLSAFEPIPDHVVWIFTTTNEGEKSLFGDCIDSSPLMSRCTQLPLALRDLAQPFAERARYIAQTEGLDGQPIEAYIKLAKKHGNNLRFMIEDIASGCMVQ